MYALDVSEATRPAPALDVPRRRRGEQLAGVRWRAHLLRDERGLRLRGQRADRAARCAHSKSYSRFGRREHFYATPTVAYGRVYIGNTDGTVYAFGARTGHLLWANHIGNYIYSAPAVWNQQGLRRHVRRQGTRSTPRPVSASGRNEVGGDPRRADRPVRHRLLLDLPDLRPHGSRNSEEGAPWDVRRDTRNGRMIWSFTGGQYSPVVADTEHLYVVGTPARLRVRADPSTSTPEEAKAQAPP